MNRDILLKILGAMPDEALLKALEVNGLKVAGQGGQDPVLDAMGHDDPDNKVKGWSSLNIVKGPDDRPSIADKDFVIQKLALKALPGGMPQDDAEGAYDAPGGF